MNRDGRGTCGLNAHGGRVGGRSSTLSAHLRNRARKALTRRSGLLLLCLLLPHWVCAACSARLYKVRRDEHSTLCARRLLVVVEAIEELEIERLHEPLEAQLSRSGAEVHIVSSAVVYDLRDPSVAEPLSQLSPDALLVIDIEESVLGILNGIPSTSIEYKLSLYEYTEQRVLVEVWKAGAMTGRRLTVERSLDDVAAQEMAEELSAELDESGMLFPCAPVE